MTQVSSEARFKSVYSYRGHTLLSPVANEPVYLSNVPNRCFPFYVSQLSKEFCCSCPSLSETCADIKFKVRPLI